MPGQKAPMGGARAGSHANRSLILFYYHIFTTGQHGVPRSRNQGQHRIIIQNAVAVKSRQIMHVHCFFELQSMSHFAERLGSYRLLFEVGVLIFFRLTMPATRFNSWWSRVGQFETRFSVWIIHRPVCFYKALGHDIHGNFCQEVNILRVAN